MLAGVLHRAQPVVLSGITSGWKELPRTDSLPAGLNCPRVKGMKSMTNMTVVAAVPNLLQIV